MLRRGVVVAFTCAACIKLAEFHGGDGGTAGGDAASADAAPPGQCGAGSDSATASYSGTAICAAGPGYVLRFPPGGFGYPDQLVLGGRDVLGKTSACNEEDRIGMAAYPMPRFSAVSPAATGEMGSASIVLPGPVVAKVAVNWAWHAGAGCASGGTVSGASSFTLFPDGRMVRFDRLTTPAASSQTPCDCASAGQAFFVTSYVTLDQTLNPVITDDSGSAYSPSTGFGTNTPALVCASGSGWGIGIAQLQTGRTREITDGAIAITSDFAGLGATSLAAGTQTTTSAFQLGGSDCSALLQPISQFTMSTGPQLHVKNGTSFDDTIGTANDGIYGGDIGSDAGLPVGGAGTLTLTSPDAIPGGWTLWIKGTIGTPTATPARTGTWYRIQNGPSGGIIWFRDGLTGSASISVPET